MIAQQGQVNSRARQTDWTIIAFFVIAHGIVWGAFGIIAIIANESGLESAQALIQMWEFISTLALVLMGMMVGIIGWRSSNPVIKQNTAIMLGLQQFGSTL